MNNMPLLKYLIFVAIFMVSCNSNRPVENIVMHQMCERLIPEYADNFQFQFLEDTIKNDRFTIESVGDKILISGNNNNSLAVGLNHYLRYYCHTNVSWYADDSVHMPETLPIVPEKIVVNAKCDNRFFLNYCTFGYTMPYWDWNDWERLIDWMALNGINMPLAITGQESVWYKVWSKLGLTDAQIRSYFTGPAHLPWHRMSNVDYWQGPLPKSWLVGQENLQKKILKRERDFDMTPVLPAFSGHVPKELKEIYPMAKIHQMSQWGGFDEQYRSHFIEPMDSLFDVIQNLFLQEQTKMYGTDHIYGIDPFNEVDSPDWNEEYLSDVSSKIYESVRRVDHEAVWLQMTWMFYHSKDKWTQSRIQSFLDAVPDKKLVLLDYYCDSTEIWRDTQSYYGKPYIWCYLGNFGGNTMMVGDIDNVDFKINRLYAEGGKNLYGLGATLEGFDVNPFMYEFVFDKAWDCNVSTREWMNNWALSRGGKENNHVLEAWRLLHRDIYVKHSTCGQAVLMNARPMLVGTDSWNTYPDIHYDNKKLWGILEELLKAGDLQNVGFRYDIVNVARQSLGNLFSTFRESFSDCYNKKDIDGMCLWAKRMDDLLLDMDRLLSTHYSFSLGKWINDARSWGVGDKEKMYYEENARCLLTVWGQKATQLNDYANRGWSGLTKSFYRERWKRFTSAVIEAVRSRKQYDPKAYYDMITEFEYQWTLQHEEIPVVSGESPFSVASELFEKYNKYFN